MVSSFYFSFCRISSSTTVRTLRKLPIRIRTRSSYFSDGPPRLTISYYSADLVQPCSPCPKYHLPSSPLKDCPTMITVCILQEYKLSSLFFSYEILSAKLMYGPKRYLGFSLSQPFGGQYYASSSPSLGWVSWLATPKTFNYTDSMVEFNFVRF